MDIKNPGRWVEKLTWPQIETKIEQGVIAVLPIGAAAKEHGRHLPLNTDHLQAQWLADEMANSLDILIWPIVGYGYYPAFVDYPGSISINAEVFAELIGQVLEGILFAGITRVVILNTGISTIPPLNTLVSKYARRGEVSVYNIYSGVKFQHAVDTLEEQGFGGHADEIETSIMLAIDESLVDMSLAGSQHTPIQRGLFNRLHAEQANFSPDGVNGEPHLATTEKGVLLLEALRLDCLAALQ